MAELVDALVLGTSGVIPVEVQVLSLALIKEKNMEWVIASKETAQKHLHILAKLVMAERAQPYIVLHYYASLHGDKWIVDTRFVPTDRGILLSTESQRYEYPVNSELERKYPPIPKYLYEIYDV